MPSIAYRSLSGSARCDLSSSERGLPRAPVRVVKAPVLCPSQPSDRLPGSSQDSTSRLNEIVLGKRGITADTAPRLGQFLKTSPQLWMRLQADWDLHQAMQREVQEGVLTTRCTCFEPDTQNLRG